eukprot:scaffold160598_cov11-Prasinocladus_malaysianus.AAC.1
MLFRHVTAAHLLAKSSRYARLRRFSNIIVRFGASFVPLHHLCHNRQANQDMQKKSILPEGIELGFEKPLRQHGTAASDLPSACRSEWLL